MNSPESGEPMIQLGDAHVYLLAAEGPEVRLSIVTPQLSVWFDMEVGDLIRFKKHLGEFLVELFEANPDIQCPACGYRQSDAQIHGDHRICRCFPFFPGERGQSEARP